MLNDTPSTARTWPTVRRNSPLRIGKYFLQPAHLQDEVGVHGAPPCRKQRTWRGPTRTGGGAMVRQSSPIISLQRG